MATPMSRYLDALEWRGQRMIREHLSLLRIGLPAVCGVAALILYWTLGGVGEHFQPGWAGSLGSAGIALLAGAALGGWLARRSADSVPRLRERLRRCLLDDGLLRLVLADDPYERLPSLRPLVPALFGLRPAISEKETLRARLDRLIEHFPVICAEASNPPPSDGAAGPAQRRPSQLSAPQMKLAFYAGSALMVFALAYDFGSLAAPLKILLVVVLVGAGSYIHSLAVHRHPQGKVTPFDQSSLERAALQLELAELLRSSLSADALPAEGGN